MVMYMFAVGHRELDPVLWDSLGGGMGWELGGGLRREGLMYTCG